MQSPRHLPSLFRRCLECPPVTPSCPSCASDETCLLQAKSCDACPAAKCVRVGSLPGQLGQSKGSPTPAIAGGVVGGVFFIIIITFLIWWFCIRKRRQQWDEQLWTDTDPTTERVEKGARNGINRSARESTRSLGSIASTVRTRASNVIQIAYIPGVTNRSPAESPGLLAPPVPAIPLGSGNNSAIASPDFEQDRHFFMPNDLRDSTFSDGSGRQSLTPSLARASNATAIYPSHAEVCPRPAQQALRGKAAVVTLSKSGNNSPSENATPEDAANPSAPQTMINSPIVARNVTARPIQVKRLNSGEKTQIPTLANLQAAATNKRMSLRPPAATDDDISESGAEASAPLMTTTRSHHQSSVETIIEDSPAVNQSQFTDVSNSSSSSVADIRPSTAAPQSSPYRSSRVGSKSSILGSMPSHQHLHQHHSLHKKSGSLSSLIEEAMTRAARDPIHGGLGSISESHNHSHTHATGPRSQGHGESDSGSGSGPFSDANELRDSPSRSS